MRRSDLKWRDRKRNFLGLPWTFTIYSLNDTRLFIERGLFSKVEDEVRLYRILDLSLRRNLWQRMFRTGTIHVVSADRTMQNFPIKNIKRPHEVTELLSNLVEKARRDSRVYAREDMHSVPADGMPGGPGFDNPDVFDHEPMANDPDFDQEMDSGHGPDGDVF